MKKLFRSFLVLATCSSFLFLTACSGVATVTQKVVEFPPQLQALLAAGVLGLVALLLRGRVPDVYVNEIAAAITTALITIVGIALRMIPTQFESVATAVLNLIVILLGTVWTFAILKRGAVKLWNRAAFYFADNVL